MRASPISRLSLTVAACLGSLSVTHADYIVVDDDGGPGVDHTTLLAAVQAASNGDRILVHPGEYLDAITTSKAIAIIGLGTSDDDRPRVTELHWTGLSPFKQASLSGFRLGAVSVTQCAGTVSLVDLAVDTWGGTLDYRAIGVEDCTDVRIRDLTLTGFADQVYMNGVLPDNNHGALHVRNSRVEVVDSRIRGPQLGDISGRAAGIRILDGSFVSVHRSYVAGGSGESGGTYSQSGPAIAVDDDDCTAVITGALGGPYTVSGVDAFGPVFLGGANEAQPGIHNEGTVRVSGVSVTGGSGTTAFPAAPPIQDNGTLFEPFPPDPSMGIEFDTTFDASGATSVAGTLTLRINGSVGEPVELLIGRRPSVTEVLPDGYPRLTQPHRTILLGVVPPSGELVHSVTLPSNVRLGDRFVLQAAVGSGVTARYTNSAPVVLR